jgi:cysteine desulfurase
MTVEQASNHIRPDTILATIQHVNSETGIMQNLNELHLFFKKQNILFHSDCVQSFTKINRKEFNKMNLDAFTVSAHKIFGPKGTGAVYISPKIHISPLLSSVTHENGFRAGTVDLPSIAAFVTAVSEAGEMQASQYEHVVNMRNLFKSLILKNEEIIFEDQSNSSPFIIPIRIKGLEGQIVQQELNKKQIAVSTGSACQNGHQTPSKALIAIGKTESEAHGLIRISLSHLTDKKDIYSLCEALEQIIIQFSSLRGVNK